MKHVMHILFLSCLKATELIEKKTHFHLSWTEKLQLKVHKFMCSGCRNYETHSNLIDKSIENLHLHHHHHSDMNIDELKRDISLHLKNH